jgi:hypothetical protein
MSEINAIALLLFAAIVGLTKSKDAVIFIIAFFISVFYTDLSGWLELTGPSFNHLTIAMVFLPTLIFLDKQVSIAVIAYIIYHWVIAGDYIFAPNTETFLSLSFAYVSPFLNVVIMAALIISRTKGDYIRNPRLVIGWLPHYINSFRLNKKMENHQ